MRESVRRFFFCVAQQASKSKSQRAESKLISWKENLDWKGEIEHTFTKANKSRNEKEKNKGK